MPNQLPTMYMRSLEGMMTLGQLDAELYAPLFS